MLLEERGRFWWHDAKWPPGNFAPDESVIGQLKIDDNGSISLELDDCMPSEQDRFRAFMDGQNQFQRRDLHGLLKSSGEYILLNKVIKTGGRVSTDTISYEQYIAQSCLIGSQPFKAQTLEKAKFKSLDIGLKGYEDWLWLAGIKAKRTNDGLVARYAKPKDYNYKIEGYRLQIAFDHAEKFNLIKPYDISIRQNARLRLKPTKPISFEECLRQYQLIEDFLMLLTDSDFSPEWPNIVFSDGRTVRLRFRRFRAKSDAAPGRHEILVNFPSIKTQFGKLFETWAHEREKFGPGFYLYFGNRRGLDRYVEDRFINLMFGLESFDRIRRGDLNDDKKVAELDRLLEQLSDESDKQQLKSLLKHSLGPNLAKRLRKTFEDLPLKFIKKGLHAFCEDCANRRNEISHLGGRRINSQNQNATRELADISAVLEDLYQLALLREIGVDLGFMGDEHRGGWPKMHKLDRLRKAGVIEKPQPNPASSNPANSLSDQMG